MRTVLHSLSYLIGLDGQPTTVSLVWAIWKSIIEQLETSEDDEILRAAMTDIQMLARHKHGDLVLDPTYDSGTTVAPQPMSPSNGAGAGSSATPVGWRWRSPSNDC